MKIDITATVIVLLAGICGILIGAFLNMSGFLGVVFAIALTCGFVVQAIKDKQ